MLKKFARDKFRSFGTIIIAHFFTLALWVKRFLDRLTMGEECADRRVLHDTATTLKMADIHAPDISVAIPVLNEIRNIPTLVKRLRAQETEYTFEIVVCDNDSDDGTLEWLQEQEDITVVHEPTRGIPIARNAAVRASRAAIILQTDADTIIPKNWIQGMGDALINEKNDFVSGAVQLGDGEINHIRLVRMIPEFTLQMWNGSEKFIPTSLLGNGFYERGSYGLNMGFSRALFEKVGGYDENLVWLEDFDFATKSKRMGAKLTHIEYPAAATSARRFMTRAGSGKASLAYAFAVFLDAVGLRKKNDTIE